MIEPAHGILHRRSGQPAFDGAADLVANDKSRIRQHVEVLHDGGQRHRERLCEFAHRRAIPLAEMRDQRAPGGIGQGGESAIERVVLILNH